MHHLFRSVPLALVMVLALGSTAADREVDALSDTALVEFFGSAGSDPPVKCGTPFAIELQARGLEVAAPAAARETLYYDTPGGHFRIAYQLDGTCALDSTDIDMTGVPDYVEQIGSAFERSWSVEIDSLGFTALDLGGERYQVSVPTYNVSYFGATFPAATLPGGSRIEIRCSMEPWCADEADPDLCEVNLLLATVAHEFKHAIQVAAGWNLFQLGGDWIELDATWIEDLVYDDSNDYYRYLELGTTPFTTPHISLASENDYRYCTWQHYLGESYGYEFMLDLSAEIAANAGNFSYYAQHAYPAVADDRGLDWTELWRGYTATTYLSGDLAAPGIGFSEAAFYPTSAADTIPELPQAQIWLDLPDMSMRFHFFDSAAADATGHVDILFEDDFGRGLTLTAVFQRPDQTVVVPVPVVGGSADFRTVQQVQDYDSFAIVVGNPRVPLRTPSAASYKLTLGLQTVPTARSSVGRFKGRFRSDAGG